MFAKHHYVNLENPVTRAFALEASQAFLKQGNGKFIIDQAQICTHA